MKLHTTFFVVLLRIFFAFGEQTFVSECTDSEGLFPDSVLIHTDSNKCVNPPCECNPGKPIHLEVNFTSPNYLEKIAPNILATAVGVNINYPLGQRDACDGIYNTQCPLAPKEPILYKYDMDLLAFLPEISLSIRFSIIDKETNKDVVCFSCDLNVVRV